MKVLVTGFNGKAGFEVARSLKENGIPMICAVRNVQKAKAEFGSSFDFTELDLADPATFNGALDDVDRIFLMYPPGNGIQFEAFLKKLKEKGIKHITYLSVKDVQFLPFIHHYKNEKLILKLGIPYTFIRAGYFMQNLNDFLLKEIIENQRIYVPAGKGKTSFIDARDIAEIVKISLKESYHHQNKKYVITGDEALNFYQVAELMTKVLNKKIEYTNPSIKEFKEEMIASGEREDFINVVIGIHIPTKLGLAKGIKHDFEKIALKKPGKMESFIEDYKDSWISNECFFT